MAVETRRHLFTVAEYQRMGEVGILPDDLRVELLDGEIVEMTPIGSRHAGAVNRLSAALSATVGSSAIVSPQNPVVLGERWQPQPDLAVLRFRSDFYAAAHAEPADIRLIVEVADSSLNRDQRTKVPAYGRFGVPEVWLVDLDGRVVHVYRVPTATGYADHRTLGSADRLRSPDLPGFEVPVVDLVG